MPTIAELQAQISEIQKKIERQKAEGKKDAIKEIKARMVEFGITIEDLQSKPPILKPIKEKVPLVIKYRKSDDETWVGRGKRPDWINEEIKRGVDISIYLVGRESHSPVGKAEAQTREATENQSQAKLF